MNSWKTTTLLLLITGLLISSCTNPGIEAQARDDHSSLPRFKKGDKICFIGNSITHGGTYHAFLQIFCATRFPDANVEYYNCGIAGDVANGMLSRLDEDVLSHNPDYAFIMSGMNDVQRGLYFRGEADEETQPRRQNALDNYYVKTEKLATLLIENGVQPIFMTPSIYDQTAKIARTNDYGTNDALAACAVHIRKMAAKYDAPLVDLFAAMESLNLKGQQSDSSFTILGHDRIHPGILGHLIMAYEIIQSLTPSQYVSIMEVDSKRLTSVRAENCIIEIDKKAKNLKFRALENALPFPLEEDLKMVNEWVPLQDSLNKEMLFLQKLPIGSYTLRIDDTEVGMFTQAELEEGVNLADYSNTPQYRQALQVSELCFKYQQIQNQLRSIAFVEYRMLNTYKGPNTIEGKKAYLDGVNESQRDKSWYSWNVKTCERYFETLPMEEGLLSELQSTREEIYSSNKPQWHTFEIHPVN